MQANAKKKKLKHTQQTQANTYVRHAELIPLTQAGSEEEGSDQWLAFYTALLWENEYPITATHAPWLNCQGRERGTQREAV